MTSLVKRMKITLTLLPSELSNHNMEEAIVKKLVDSLQDKCYDNYFVKEITNIFPVKHGRIGDRGEVDYQVEFEARVLKIEVDDIVTGFVQKIISNGIFVEYEMLRCFVKRQFFTQEEWDDLRLNHPMTVQLKTFRYVDFNKNLSCVGEPVSS